MRQKLELGAGLVVAVAFLALLGYAVYDRGHLLVEIFGLVHALLVVGGLVIACLSADFVAPRADGGSWFGVLLDVMPGSGDDDGE